MKKLLISISALFLVTIFMSCNLSQENTKKDEASLKNVEEENYQEAIDSAQSWLSLIDSRNYSKSWNKAASIFKRTISKEKWGKTLRGDFLSYGKVIERKLISSKYFTELPGVPDGEYVVVQFKTSFENKKKSIETVTPMKDNGKWRVSGYYIK